MNKNFLIKLASLGFIGNLPAPGTWATIFTAFFVVLLSKYSLSLNYYILIVIIVLVVSLLVVKKSMFFFENPDPKEIVLDEVVGTFITFCGISITPFSLIAGIVFFRLLDITKPLLISKLEKVPGVAGIFLDDILAAIISNLLLKLTLFICMTY